MPGETLFHDDIDRRKFLEILENSVHRYDLLLHSFVLLDDGYRLLFETLKPNMTKSMQYVNSHYTAYANTRRKQAKQIFKGRYLSTVIEKPRYLMKVCRYIHLLPVQRGLVGHPDIYPWSSHPKFVLPNDQPPTVYTRDILESFGGSPRRRRKRYQQVMESGIRADLLPITILLKKNRVLGSESFVEKINTAGEERPALASIDPNLIVAETAKFHNVAAESVVDNKTKPNPARNAAIYLCRNMTDTPLEKLGELFDVGPSSICNTAKRVDAHRKSEESLAKELREIESNVRQLL
jgi:REP element-mobilizing transposase RayT